jgi:hypothetical protein
MPGECVVRSRALVTRSRKIHHVRTCHPDGGCCSPKAHCPMNCTLRCLETTPQRVFRGRRGRSPSHTRQPSSPRVSGPTLEMHSFSPVGSGPALALLASRIADELSWRAIEAALRPDLRRFQSGRCMLREKLACARAAQTKARLSPGRSRRYGRRQARRIMVRSSRCSAPAGMTRSHSRQSRAMLASPCRS